MSHKRAKKTFIGNFGGVALADILANGVVVLLVVIIITINQKKIQAEQETEQSVEISAVLARDIASSLVFNDLPSSPPAVLHNYECVSPNGPWRNEYERHDCLTWLYPIFELHKDYVRERNSGRIFTRGELLQENNALDTYLTLLNPTEKQRARLDIYAVDMYYLGLSILREGGVSPSHWHFMGESVPLPPSGDEGVLGKYGEELANATALGDEEEDAGESESSATEESLEESGGETQSEIAEENIPEDASLREAELIEELLPPNDENTLGRGGRERRGSAEILSEFQADGEGGYGDLLAEELARGILEERRTGGESFGAPSSITIRVPFGAEGGPSEEANLLFQQIFGNNFPTEGEQVDYHIFMIVFLNEYLRRVDEKGIDGVDINKMYVEFLSGAFSQARPEDLAIARELKEEMRLAFQAGEGLLKIELQPCSFCLSQLSLKINDPLDDLTLFSINPFRRAEQRTDLVNVEMRLFPYPDQGKVSEIFRGDTLLVPQDIVDTERWYPVAILDPNISDVVVGYVYGGEVVERAGFGLFGDINRLYLQRGAVSTRLPGFPSRREFVLSIIYGSAVFLILVMLLIIGRGIALRRKIVA